MEYIALYILITQFNRGMYSDTLARYWKRNSWFGVVVAERLFTSMGLIRTD